MSRGQQVLFVALLLATSICVPVQSQSILYQDRGDRFEGICKTQIAGESMELISALVDYKEQMPSRGMPERFHLKFIRHSDDPVFVTVHDIDQDTDYRMDRVRPPGGWRLGWANDFSWPTGTVIKYLSHVCLYDLGVVIRLRRDTPAQVEYVSPAILYHESSPAKVPGYIFTFRVSARTRIAACAIYQGNGTTPVFSVSGSRLVPANGLCNVSWNPASSQEGTYRLVATGTYDSLHPFSKTIVFYHQSRIAP